MVLIRHLFFIVGHDLDIGLHNPLARSRKYLFILSFFLVYKTTRIFTPLTWILSLFPLSWKVMEVLMSLQGAQMETDDPTTSYMLQVCL